ncbi:pyruvate:ferredoxin oxidoreductase subunit gamma [Candidatus Termititenax persephonae]|uniref:Pyruvate:ferredoxin oxidoreductase subunit gamma n=1 Tax=Candidatus Termititenax persephonae TaxID=2218525 RepID=A0A388TEF2_9BACT|nr:pyruvate:ferredoxin oxidoreductase subunit gamma [Candidatus Termititenax persephonae]
MAETIEIRWHGRGGQGAKTAALLVADAAIATGKLAQAFPEYGPERMGAPVKAFNRISDQEIRIHCSVEHPSIVLVLDETLVDSVNILEGVPANGTIIINTEKSADEYRQQLGFQGSLYTVNASGIALKNIGMNKPNTPMLGALVKATGILDYQKMLEDTTHKLEKKFKNKPEVIEGNVKAIQDAYEEVNK